MNKQTPRPGKPPPQLRPPPPHANDIIRTLPSRTSFMGLPVELRIRIYEVIWFPDCVGKELDHCCGITGDCRCLAKHSLALLRVNKQVCAEATPIFKAGCETDYGVGPMITFPPSREDLPPFPTPRMLVKAEAWDPREEVYVHLPKWREFMKSELAIGLKHIRVHYDLILNPGWMRTHHGWTWHNFAWFESIAELANLPALKTVHLQAHLIFWDDSPFCPCWHLKLKSHPFKVEVRRIFAAKVEELQAEKEVKGEKRKNDIQFDMDVHMTHSKCCKGGLTERLLGGVEYDAQRDEDEKDNWACAWCKMGCSGG